MSNFRRSFAQPGTGYQTKWWGFPGVFLTGLSGSPEVHRVLEGASRVFFFRDPKKRKRFTSMNEVGNESFEGFMFNTMEKRNCLLRLF